jgi:hypothetical protein
MFKACAVHPWRKYAHTCEDAFKLYTYMQLHTFVQLHIYGHIRHIKKWQSVPYYRQLPIYMQSYIKHTCLQLHIYAIKEG